MATPVTDRRSTGAAPPGGRGQAGTGLTGRLTTPRIVFLVVAAAAPLAATVGTIPLAFAFGTGPGVPAMYLLAGLVLLCFSVGYAAMSRRVPSRGGFYGYLEAGLGRRVARAGGLVAVLSYNAASIGLLAAFGYFANLVAAPLGLSLPWQVWAGIALVAMSVLGYRQIDLSAKLLAVLMAAEIGVVAVLVVGVVAHRGAAAFPAASFSPGAVVGGAVGVSMMFAFMSFIGFESAAMYGEETVNPKRSVPLATYSSVVVIALLYTLVSWAAVGGIGAPDVAGAAGTELGDLFFGLADRYVAGWFSLVMQVLLCTSLFAAALALHSAANRYTLVLGTDRVLPAALGRVHRVHGSPSRASAAHAVLALVVLAVAALVGLDPYTDLATSALGLGTVGLVVLQAGAAVAVPVFFRAQGDRRWWRTLVAPALAALGLVASAALLVVNFGLLAGGTGNPVVAALPALLAVAALVGFVRAPRG